ncbi:YugE family protein [Bacillus sp. Marseille-P3661]|uniref:YugE family protein n=1 Tax=Bacillus sp. Marseille-P3661 TaxID=1936234 RepID=UPI002155D208|nr:YugE family protein [Bacillus sp. Marseille-P3661]
MLNEKIREVINDWDPLGYGSGSYEVEVVDVIQAVHEINDLKYLAKRIQFIYEFSFEQLIPFAECQEVAKKVLALKETIPYAV